jgi:hypothetical protein
VVNKQNYIILFFQLCYWKIISLDERLNLTSDIQYCILVRVNFFQMLNLLTKFTEKQKEEEEEELKYHAKMRGHISQFVLCQVRNILQYSDWQLQSYSQSQVVATGARLDSARKSRFRNHNFKTPPRTQFPVC